MTVHWRRQFLAVVFFFHLFLLVGGQLQYCSGFCHTLTWISHGFTCVPHPEPHSHLPPHPIPLGYPGAPALSTCLMHPTCWQQYCNARCCVFHASLQFHARLWHGFGWKVSPLSPHWVTSGAQGALNPPLSGVGGAGVWLSVVSDSCALRG